MKERYQSEDMHAERRTSMEFAALLILHLYVLWTVIGAIIA